MSILIRKDTRFIVQGITGREAVNLTRENLEYGAKIVGGVTPGRAGRDIYGVMGEDGSIYWIEVDRMRTLRKPKQAARYGNSFQEL